MTVTDSREVSWRTNGGSTDSAAFERNRVAAEGDEARASTGVLRVPGIGPVSSRVLLTVAVIVAALLRIAWALKFGHSIEQEGAEYARLGENLLAGRGYVGIFNNGTQLNFPPGYPVLIALVTLVVGNSELAARTINIVLGSVLVLPMFGIARRLYGNRVALGVAALAVFHPVLIAGGASTYAEGPYLTLLIIGVYALVRAVLDGGVRFSVVAGAFFGFAYLVRPEAVVLTGVFFALGLVAAVWAPNRRAVVRGSAALLVAFLVVALPNIVFLTVSTGKFRFEAKGTLAYQWGSRINSGMSYEEAIMGVGDDLSDQGVFMRPNADVINSPAPSLPQYLAFLLTAAGRNTGDLMNAVVNQRAFGAPLLFALVVLGLFQAGWSRERILGDGVLLLTVALLLLVLLTVQALWFRYFYPLLGFLLIWGAKGADDLRDWARASLASVIENRRISAAAGTAVKWAAIAMVLAISLRTMPSVDQYREMRFPERAAAGRWIAAQQTRQAWVMDSGLQVPYYANANLQFLPYTSSDVAIRYIEKHKPDFIVLHSLGKQELPYTARWFDEGIPDTRAVLVYDRGVAPEDQIKIYRWIDGRSTRTEPAR